MCDDIPATSQEKFLMMINERVGTMEERLFELHTMVTGICEYLFVDTLSCSITLPASVRRSTIYF